MLATLVRASTAAPHFFDPEILAIIDEQAQEPLGDVNQKLGRFPRLTMWLTKLRALMIAGKSGPTPETHGLFVDGGVTPFNNPSIALLMQVVLKRFQVCWPLGPDELTFVSIGTGAFRAKLSFTELGFAGPLKLALHSLLSMMSDTQNQALALMQWLGHCPNPWLINSEIGDLGGEEPPGHRWFRFMRYDIRLEQDWLKANLKKDLTEEAILSYRNMDDPGIIQHIYELAVEAAHAAGEAGGFLPGRRSRWRPAGAAYSSRRRGMNRKVADGRLRARQRIGRVPGIAQRLEPHRACVDHEQPPDQALAEAHDLADDFERHHGAEHARHGAEHAGLCAGRHGTGRRRLREQAAVGRIRRAVGRALMRADGRERAVERAHGRRDQRLPRKEAGVGDEIAGGEIVGAIGDKVVTRDEIERVGGSRAAQDAAPAPHAD